MMVFILIMFNFYQLITALVFRFNLNVLSYKIYQYFILFFIQPCTPSFLGQFKYFLDDFKLVNSRFIIIFQFSFISDKSFFIILFIIQLSFIPIFYYNEL